MSLGSVMDTLDLLSTALVNRPIAEDQILDGIALVRDFERRRQEGLQRLEIESSRRRPDTLGWRVVRCWCGNRLVPSNRDVNVNAVVQPGQQFHYG